MVSAFRTLAWCVAVACLLVAPAARAREPRPEIRVPVTDLDDALSAESERALEQQVTALARDTGYQLAILVVATTAGEPIEDYAQAVFKAWGGGQKGEDDGLLIVLAMGDHRSRVHLGYGVERVVSDATAVQLLEGMKPKLRAGDTAGALEDLLDSLRSRLAREPTDSPMPGTAEPPARPASGILIAVLALVLGFAFVIGLRRRPAANDEDDLDAPSATWRLPTWSLVAIPVAAFVAVGFAVGTGALPLGACFGVIGAVLGLAVQESVARVVGALFGGVFGGFGGFVFGLSVIGLGNLHRGLESQTTLIVVGVGVLLGTIIGYRKLIDRGLASSGSGGPDAGGSSGWSSGSSSASTWSGGSSSASTWSSGSSSASSFGSSGGSSDSSSSWSGGGGDSGGGGASGSW